MKKPSFLNDIVIVDSGRTAIGARLKGLKDYTAAQLGGVVIKELIQRNEFDSAVINEVIFGNTVSAGVGQNIAKQAAHFGGLPEQVSAYTVNNVCGSGLQSAVLALQSIACGASDIIIAGSAESASHCPTINKNNVDAPVESLILDGLWCQMCDKHMGQLAEETAQKCNITRIQQDHYAFESHSKAIAAQDEGKFKKEIIPVVLDNEKIVEIDEKPRRSINTKRLASLPAAFVDDGMVTAGNSCSPCDGAAAVILASKEKADALKLTPRAQVIGYATRFVAPEMTFTAATKAIPACLESCGLTIDDIDLFEISEAFAVQAIYTKDTLKIPGRKINIWGGDIALGHPLGAAGTRIMVTLLHALADQKKKRGLATACFGGGGAMALAVELL